MVQGTWSQQKYKNEITHIHSACTTQSYPPNWFDIWLHWEYSRSQSHPVQSLWSKYTSHCNEDDISLWRRVTQLGCNQVNRVAKTCSTYPCASKNISDCWKKILWNTLIWWVQQSWGAWGFNNCPWKLLNLGQGRAPSCPRDVWWTCRNLLCQKHLQQYHSAEHHHSEIVQARLRISH